MPFVKNFIAWSSNTTLGWAAIVRMSRFDRKLQKLLRFAERHRSIRSTNDFYGRVKAKFSDQKVRHGPFKGLRYGELQSQGSTLIPKLLGSYENEVHSWLEDVPSKGYDIVVDIGCAEGYYAIGLARLLPEAKIFAYDIEPASRKSCEQLAHVNGVSDQLSIGSFCSSETLRSLDFSSGGLIISDCEGYETELFDAETVRHLANVDLLIECHDHIGLPITRTLIDAFSQTHKTTVFETTPDHRKALDLALPELENEPYPVRLYMVEERREAPQNFLLLEAYNRK